MLGASPVCNFIIFVNQTEIQIQIHIQICFIAITYTGQLYFGMGCINTNTKYSSIATPWKVHKDIFKISLFAPGRDTIIFILWGDVIFTDYKSNLSIRVGEDGNELGNNKICREQIDFRSSDVANITCSQALFGDWISIHTYQDHLFLCEIRVFRSK